MQDVLHQIQDPVIVLANGANPLDDKPREGYHQRVATVDSYLGARNRIYVKTNPSAGPIHSIRQLGNGCVELEIGDQYSSSVVQLFRRAVAIYSHSILPLVSPHIRYLVGLREGKFIVDMHGVVPEETSFMGDEERAQTLGQLESWAVLEADVRIYVTRRMSAHYSEKYPWILGFNIICPIFPEIGNTEQPRHLPNATVVYAGGAQAWQMVDRIVESVHASLSAYATKILTHEPEIFRQKFLARGCPIDDVRLSVYAARPADVRTVYSKSSYGILCREPHILNRVACPTKLIEYLSFGLLPIMGSPEVGDFVDLGMRYASMEDLSECRLPVADEYMHMVDKNFIVLERFAELAETGRKQLLALIR
ncbi:hypothetical protein ACOTEK_16405 [Achromobacter xylosoxidans]|jgi:hypothetical protein|uniref:hypothetical protein n=1 Tax=Alcaligenes xylosoxydans xylosoxydans TaxID=85698 RepID=UPI0006C62129|nr:hypothetical protein [Achromobacter xylosoxidans]QQE55272.1 hypothetical protein I6H41_20310 [Achromobacter xylosoxidans]QQV14916.1 hypothetical protein I6I48_03250 [Achromobacter xylosoxidans]UXL04975.1 hypothetical protein N4T34_29780 [Achromobacter xylosoxidans]CUI80534.1 Uncharacterised protein [Achromobacter xylosoxidans]